MKNRIFPLLVQGPFGKSLSKLFRIFASKQNLWYGLWRTVRLYTYQYESFCFVFFFLRGGGGKGWGLGRGCQGANFRDNYINNSNHISAEINYQLLFLISLSFSKIYYTLSYISINSQTFANPERIVYTWILSNSCSDNKCTSFMYWHERMLCLLVQVWQLHKDCAQGTIKTWLQAPFT